MCDIFLRCGIFANSEYDVRPTLHKTFEVGRNSDGSVVSNPFSQGKGSGVRGRGRGRGGCVRAKSASRHNGQQENGKDDDGFRADDFSYDG